MPLYDYRSDDGRTREVFVTSPAPEVILEDGISWRRCAVQPFALAGFRSPETQGQAILRGYRDQEARLGSRFHTKFPVSTIKRAWEGDRMPLFSAT